MTQSETDENEQKTEVFFCLFAFNLFVSVSGILG